MAATWTHTTELPTCDLCKQMAETLADQSKVKLCVARVDGRTTHGPWAAMCLGHYRNYGVGLGVGMGQYLLLPKETLPDWVRAYGRGRKRGSGVQIA